jgi:hypothetical protein
VIADDRIQFEVFVYIIEKILLREKQRLKIDELPTVKQITKLNNNLYTIFTKERKHNFVVEFGIEIMKVNIV